MRRKEKEIKDNGDILTIIEESTVLRLGLCHHNIPYIVPVCFGYDGKNFFIHSAPVGKKIDILKDNPNVSFELDTDAEIVISEKACDWSMKYKSIIGSGKAVQLRDIEEKKEGLKIIMDHYSDKEFEFKESSVKATAVFRIDISELKGKSSGF